MRARKQLFAVGAALAVIVGVAGCGDDDGDTTSDGDDAAAATTEAADDTTTAEEPAATDAPATEAPEATEGGSEMDAPTVEIATDDTFGDYLVDADGLTLYVFTQDEGTTSACTSDQCIDAWPALAADDPVAGDGIDEAELGTADALAPNQVTYHGQLLYYFVGDQGPGDITGTDIDDWYPVAPDGTAIDLDDDGDGDDGDADDDVDDDLVNDQGGY